MTTQIFKIKIDISPKDFCESDLEEVIEDGLKNVGNYDLNKLEIKKVLK